MWWCGGGLQGAAVLLTELKSVCGVERDYKELLCYSLG